MSASATFKVPDAVRDVLARSTITATSVRLPDGQLERKLYEQTNKVLTAAGGKWNKKAAAHLFERDPREALGIAVEQGTATNMRTLLQAFYTPAPLADRLAGKAKLKHGTRVLEPSVGSGSLVLAAARVAAVVVDVFDIDELMPARMDMIRPTLEMSGCSIRSAMVCDFTTVSPVPAMDAVLMNPPFQGGQDVRHVTHAWRFVKPGGVLVAIMWPAWRTANTAPAIAFRDLVAGAASSEVEDIEGDTFEDTAVRTVMLTMRKGPP